METSVNNFLASQHKLKLTHVEDPITVMESGMSGMIFTLDDIDDKFFDLKNGILGETFQKFVNYRFPVAIVLPADHGFGLRVTELAREHARHDVVRFCKTMEEAKAWMIKVLG